MLMLALALSLAGTTLQYLAHPNQVWRARSLPTSMRRIALLVWLGSSLPWLAELGPSAGLFAWLTTSMLAWVLVPYLGWWLQTRQPTVAVVRQ